MTNTIIRMCFSKRHFASSDQLIHHMYSTLPPSPKKRGRKTKKEMLSTKYHDEQFDGIDVVTIHEAVVSGKLVGPRVVDPSVRRKSRINSQQIEHKQESYEVGDNDDAPVRYLARMN